jgi:cold shock CspA family protein
MVGHVKSVQRGSGTGYIRDNAGRDFFFHKGDVLNKGFNDLDIGVAVTFEIIEDPISGARAAQIKPTTRRAK